MKEFYAHTIERNNFHFQDISILYDIFNSGYIYSRRNLQKITSDPEKTSEETSLFNGLDYISLCDLTKNHNGKSAYNSYTRGGLSLLIDHSIEVITPTLLDMRLYDYDSIKKLDLINNRYTDFKDEVQVKDQISLDYLRGMCLPLSGFFVNHDKKYLERYLGSIYELLEDYGYRIPIYNLDTWEKIKIKKSK